MSHYRIVVLSAPWNTGEAALNKLADDDYDVVAIVPGYVSPDGYVTPGMAIVRRGSLGWASIFAWVAVVLASLAAAVVAVRYGVR